MSLALSLLVLLTLAVSNAVNLFFSAENSKNCICNKIEIS